MEHGSIQANARGKNREDLAGSETIIHKDICKVGNQRDRNVSVLLSTFLSVKNVHIMHVENRPMLH